MVQARSRKPYALRKSLSAAEPTASYESLAVLGMTLPSSQITWRRNPRAAGADALKARMLQTPPDRIGVA